MALMSTKTPIESILGNFEKKHVDAIYSAAAQTIISHSEFRNKHFAYSLDNYKKKRLTEAGVELYPNGYMPHSHPFSKLVENHLLFDVLPSLVTSKNLIMCSIKESKVLVFKNIKKEEDISFINRVVASKDLARYKEECESFYAAPTHDNFFSNNFIRSIKKKKEVFFHDEVHHWTKKQMFFFLKETGVKRFLFTIVYPPEILMKYANSQNPKLYTFKVEKGKLFFFPDGVQTEAYEQQLNLHWLFSASHLESEGKRWTVTRHKSLFAHHLFEISVGDLKTDSVIFFNDYQSVNLSKLFLDRWKSYEVFPIPLQHLYKVYSYLLCLKKPDLESGLAKLRQIIGDDVEIKEFLFFEQFCKRIIERQTSWALFGYSFMEKLTDMALSKMPNNVARLFPSWKKKNTFEFLMSLGTLEVRVERQTVFEHVLQEWGFEVVNTNENAFLDPMEIFGLNENFNDERVDDGYLDRVKLPLWRYGNFPISGRHFRANRYDLLSIQLSCSKDEWTFENERGREMDSECGGPTKEGVPLLEFIPGKRVFFPDTMSFEDSRDATILSLTKLPQLSVFGSKIAFEAVHESIDQVLGFKRNKIDIGLLISICVNTANCLVKEIDAMSEHTEFADDFDFSDHELKEGSNPFFLELEENMKGSESECDGRESEIDREGNEVKGEAMGPSVEMENQQIVNYRRIFEVHDCNSAHGEPVNVPADGNCFFHCFLVLFSSEFDHVALRSNFCDWLMELNHKETRTVAEYIKEDGVFMDAESIYLFCCYANISIVMHEGEFGNEKIFIINSGFEEGHMLKKGEHFLALPIIKINVELSPLLEECPRGYSDELLKFKINEDDFRCFKWRGRRSAFLTKVDADYGHNGMMYPINGWSASMDDIIRICNVGDDFNCALINFYDAGSELGWHRDNERVYNDDPILTVNIRGDGLFKVEFKKETVEFLMTSGAFFLMPKGFQKKARHSVSCATERISITFRKHVRRMNGTPVQIEESQFKNVCLIRAIAEGLNRNLNDIISALKSKDFHYWNTFLRDAIGGTFEDCEMAINSLGISANLMFEGKCVIIGEGDRRINLKLENNHFSLVTETIQMERTLVSKFRQKGNLNVADGLRDYLSVSGESFNVLNFIATREFARTLVNSFLNMNTGICCGKVLDNGEKIFEANINNDIEEIGYDIMAVCGFAGSGKSRKLQNWLEGRKKGNFVVVSPRNNLAHDWQFKLKLESRDARKIQTFEKFLKSDKSKLDLIVFDELTLFPNGYLDIIVFELNKVNPGCQIICLFDPLQSRYHSKLDEHILTFDHDVDRMINDREIKYLYGSFRMTKFFDRFFEDLPCLNGSEFDESRKVWIFSDIGEIREISEQRGEECQVLLVESELEKKAFSTMIPTMTFGESQGLTFNHVCIALSESSANSNEYRWMVALTRSKQRVSFVCTYLGGIDEFKSRKGSGMICKILNQEKITASDLRKMVKSDLNFIRANVGRSDFVDREERLEGDPFLKPFIFTGQRINAEKIIDEEVEITEPSCQTHLFISEPNFGLCYNFDFIREKEQREYREDMLCTNQFCDSYEKVHIRGKRETPGPMRFKAIYPKHSADDDMTFWMAVKKRLVFREEEENYQRLSKSHLIGGLLYQEFKRAFKLDFRFDQGLLEESVNAFEVKKLSKSVGTIKSHSIRSDVDWALNDVFLFMKSQLCTKYEKQFVDAKAGQTLACFQHLILVQFAPWCRYLESQIREQLPPEIYIHSNRNFDDLNRWVKKFFQRDICVESDYEAFDASQDEYILSFEIHLMKDANFPQEIIDAYIELKCKLGCKLGHFAIMRFTGEFCTFLFNTLANMAFTLCRYNWREGQPIAFAGDDMCALNNLTVRHEFDEVFEAISLKAKVERTETPMFCGWRLTQYGIVKEPELVYNRFQVAIEEGKVMECLENYAIEVSYAYSLSERLYEVLKSERQIQYHQAVVRFIVTHIDKLKTKVRDLFLEQSSDEDI